MTLRLPDKWVWDFWLVRDGRDYHAFYLQASRSLGDPELRHLNASVGHAVPKDPLIEADPRYYEQRDEGAVGYERMWRDPWVFWHPRKGECHALITARTIEGPADGR